MGFLFARPAGEPLAGVLAARATASSGVSIGIQRRYDLVLNVERELAAGYRRIKMKIKPGWDLHPVEAVRARFGPIPLMVDANAAYTHADADHLARLDAFDLMMIEQPLDYDDVADHAALQRRLDADRLDETITRAPSPARRSPPAQAI